MMLPPFPFFRFPMSYNSYRNPYYYNNFQRVSDNNTSYLNNKNHQSTVESHPSVSSASTRSSSEQFFDIFGIRLYFDDILILCLLFFLYQEEVQDQFLFIALLLLLLS